MRKCGGAAVCLFFFFLLTLLTIGYHKIKEGHTNSCLSYDRTTEIRDICTDYASERLKRSVDFIQNLYV